MAGSLLPRSFSDVDMPSGIEYRHQGLGEAGGTQTGDMVLGMVERGEWPEKRLQAAMDRYLERDQDRRCSVYRSGQPLATGRTGCRMRMVF